MAGYMTSAVVSAHLNTLAQQHPTVVTRSTTTDWGPARQGGTTGYVKVAKSGGSTPRWAVLLTGGVHARELAPPDALVSFVEKLVGAYTAGSSITYPAWTDPVNKIVYDAFTIPWPWVRTIVDKLDLYVAPLVNPDGRDFVLTKLGSGASYGEQELHKGWRKNRRAAPSGNTDPNAVGVDLNRNFDVLWNFPVHYDTSIADVQSSTDPASEVYIGPVADGPEAEPEAKNVGKLMRDKGVSFFIDFHAFSRDVLYSWGIEADQTTDATKTFTNTAWDGKRDGVKHTTYAEYIPDSTLSAVKAMAQRISDQVYTKAGGSDPKAQARSRYTVMPSAGLYVTSGAVDDYCFSRWFTAPSHGGPIPPVMAFTIEVGGDPSKGADFDEGGFSPDYVTQYPKLEREIHVAAFAFLSAVAATGVVPGYAPPAPATKTSDPLCFVAGAAYGDDRHPDVLFLRDVRDRQLPAGPVGWAFHAVLVAGYRRIGPVLAARLRPHPHAARLVRDALLRPFVAALRAAGRPLRERPRWRALVLVALFLAAWPVATGVAVVLAALLAGAGCARRRHWPPYGPRSHAPGAAHGRRR